MEVVGTVVFAAMAVVAIGGVVVGLGSVPGICARLRTRRRVGDARAR